MRAGTLAGGIILIVVGILVSTMAIPIAQYVDIPFLGSFQYGTSYIALESIGYVIIAIWVIVTILGAVLPSGKSQLQVVYTQATVPPSAPTETLPKSQQPPQEYTAVICPNCKSRNPATDKFCGECGEPI